MKLVEFVPPVKHPLWKLCLQMGITDVIVKVNPTLTGLGDPWRYETLKKIVDGLKAEGLTVVGLEGDPFDMSPIKEFGARATGEMEREEALAHYRELLESMAKLGIHLLCYNFMVGPGWSRTGVREVRGGAKATYFNKAEYEAKFAASSEGLLLTKDQVWANYEYFIKSVMPTAEKVGVRMGLHPDDPCLPSLGGYARILETVADYDRAYAIYPSESNAVTFCQANFKLMGADLVETARHFGERIAFIHVRDVEGDKNDFTELFHDQGTTDQFELMRTYRSLGLDVPVRGDHVPEMEGDRKLVEDAIPGYFNMGRLFANGYLKALLKGTMAFAVCALGLLAEAAESLEIRSDLQAKIAGLIEPPAARNLKGRPGWDSRFRTLKSSCDGTLQPFYWYDPGKEGPVPLVVALHSWGASCYWDRPAESVCGYCRKHGWAMLYPNFRGPNVRPEACGSDLAVQDILDAIAWAKKERKIDADRVYIIGGSGGGYMTLLMAGRFPGVFAGAAAFCPITDLTRWHADSTLRKNHYARNIAAACGGLPDERPLEYRKRSALTHLGNARTNGVPVYIVTGIHDGHTGSVPVGHAIRAYNALADGPDRISEADIATIEEKESVPEALRFNGSDPFYGPKSRIHLRATSANVRLTLFEAGHNGNYPAGLDFLSRQVKGRPADMTLPETPVAVKVEGITK